MNKLLNDTLRVKGYKGPYYTDTIKTISSIKKEVKLLTDNGKGVIEEVTENDLKKLVDDTPTIKLADNVAKESTGLKETVKVGENFG